MGAARPLRSTVARLHRTPRVDPLRHDADKNKNGHERCLRLKLLQRVRADHKGEAAEEFRQGKAEDEAVKDDYVAEAVHCSPPAVWRKVFCQDGKFILRSSAAKRGSDRSGASQ